MFVRVIDVDNENDAVEIPVESDGCVLLSTLCAQFPGASGLKYRNEESGTWRAVRVADNKLLPAEGDWSQIENYYVVYPKDAKRKVDDDVDSATSKLRRVEPVVNQCTDLIVLGINFKSTEDSLQQYFEQFGELALCEIKRDFNGQSKGFGFIRFKEYDAQMKSLERKHIIDGRSCQVKIPESKTVQAMRKIFVARLPQGSTSEDLRKYFSKFGEVIDVYLSQPFRSFGFVTFKDASVIPLLYSQQHIFNGSNLHIGPAEPKGSSGSQRSYQSHSNWQGGRPHRRGGAEPRYDSNDNFYEGDNTPVPDMSHMAAQMLSPAMMATFLNLAAQQQGLMGNSPAFSNQQSNSSSVPNKDPAQNYSGQSWDVKNFPRSSPAGPGYAKKW